MSRRGRRDGRFRRLLANRIGDRCGPLRSLAKFRTAVYTRAGLDVLLDIRVVPGDPANDRELARAQIPRPAFYLLRPDTHIGLCGTHLDIAAITRYLSERLRLGIRSA